MKLRRRRDPEVDSELQRSREALLAVCASLASRLDALERQAVQTQALLVKLPAQTAWATRFLSDAQETPEMLEALACEVAAFKLERPTEYTEILTTIRENANARS